MEKTGLKIIDKPLLDRTSEHARQSPRLRMNHNFHARGDAPVNRFLNAMEPGTYLPVHRHTSPAKSESTIVLRGRVAVFIFDDEGRVTQRMIVDPSEGIYGFDIEAGLWHGLLVLQSDTVVFEVKSGPYEPISTVDVAPWAPAADDAEGVARFIRRLRDELPPL